MLHQPTKSIDEPALQHSFALFNETGKLVMGDTLIIGSGMAGITCARALTQAALPVRLLDKGRKIGGRMATRTVVIAGGDVSFDHGAQYLRPRDPEFAETLAQTRAQSWPDASDHGLYVGVPGMSDIPRMLADGLDVTQQTDVTSILQDNGGWQLTTSVGAIRASRLVLTIPAPQVIRLLGHAHPFAADLGRVVMEPSLTLMAAFPADSPRPFVERLDPSHPLAWIAQDSTKPGRAQAAVSWVAQAVQSFSKENLEADPEKIAARMLALLAEVLGADPVKALYVRAHRWRYAQASTPLGRPFLRNDDRTLYSGGDWCLGARAEDAWRSGRAMAHDILEGQSLN